MKNLYVINRLLNQFNTRGYLVGGVVRDWLLEQATVDFDLLITDQVKKIAAKFSEKTASRLVVLDKERKIYRVVGNEASYDFSPVQGTTLSEDLLHRDLTINALALPLTKSVLKQLGTNIPQQKLIDPTGGQNDLNQGLIRAVSETAFAADPLRLLRAVRFKMQLGFKITAQTEQVMKQEAHKIVTIAEERIKQELIKILQCQQSANAIAYLEDKFALLSYLVSDISKLKANRKCQYYPESIWTHSVYAVEKLEQLGAVDFWQKRIKNLNWPLLKLATLFHDIGKLLTAEVVDEELHFSDQQTEDASYFASILENLTFSNHEIDYLTTVVNYHKWPLNLYSEDKLMFQDKYSFFQATAEWTADICLLSAAEMLSTVDLNSNRRVTDSREFLRGLVLEKEEQIKKMEPLLVSGTDIMEFFSLPEGPQIGELLAQIQKAQAAELVSTREEALNYLQKIINEGRIDN